MVQRFRHPNKVFDLTHKGNIKKTREAITPIVDTVKLCIKIFHLDVTGTV